MKTRLPYKMLKSPKIKKFNNKIYRFYTYEPMKSEANKIVRSLRDKGISARIVPQPGLGGGWNIYTRKRK